MLTGLGVVQPILSQEGALNETQPTALDAPSERSNTQAMALGLVLAIVLVSCVFDRYAAVSSWSCPFTTDDVAWDFDLA